VYAGVFKGEWDQALVLAREISEAASSEEPSMEILGLVALVHIHRGDLAAAADSLARISGVGASENLDLRMGYEARRSQLLLAKGRAQEALELAQEAWNNVEVIGPAYAGVIFTELGEAAFATGRLEVV